MRGLNIGDIFKWLVILIILILGVAFIAIPAIYSPGIRFIIIIFLLIALWRLFKEQFEMSEGASLFLAVIITYFIWKSFTLAIFFVLGVIFILVVLRNLKT